MLYGSDNSIAWIHAFHQLFVKNKQFTISGALQSPNTVSSI